MMLYVAVFGRETACVPAGSRLGLSDGRRSLRATEEYE